MDADVDARERDERRERPPNRLPRRQRLREHGRPGERIACVSRRKRRVLRPRVEDRHRRNRRERPVPVDERFEHVVDRERRKRQRRQQLRQLLPLQSPRRPQRQGDSDPHPAAAPDDAQCYHHAVDGMDAMADNPRADEMVQIEQARRHQRIL